MKPKLLFNLALYFGLFIQSCPAQTYTPFPDSNAVWSVLDFSQFYPFSLKYQTIQYVYGNDTTINNKTYHKIYSNAIDTIIFTTSINSLYVGALRQDTTLKKVYFVPKDSINDILLYDFNINIGDTVYIQNYVGTPQKYRCYYIGYYLCNDGIERKFYKILVLDGYTWDLWIEGVGNNKGLFNHFYIFKWYNELQCFYKDNTQVYKLDSIRYWDYPYYDSTVVFSGCYHNNIIISANDNYSTHKACYLFPNPFTNITVISLPEYLLSGNVIIEIFDALGSVKKTIKTSKSNRIIINKNDLGASGLYFARVKCGTYQETIKLLVQ